MQHEHQHEHEHQHQHQQREHQSPERISSEGKRQGTHKAGETGTRKADLSSKESASLQATRANLVSSALNSDVCGAPRCANCHKRSSSSAKSHQLQVQKIEIQQSG